MHISLVTRTVKNLGLLWYGLETNLTSDQPTLDVDHFVQAHMMNGCFGMPLIMLVYNLTTYDVLNLLSYIPLS